MGDATAAQTKSTSHRKKACLSFFWLATVVITLLFLALADDTCTTSLSLSSGGAVNSFTDDQFGIVLMVMGEGDIFSQWRTLASHLRASEIPIFLIYASWDKEIIFFNQTGEGYRTLFIPNTTWTEGRTLLGEEALKREMLSRRKYQMWAFSDDDISIQCLGMVAGLAMEAAQCWQRIFESTLSDNLPGNASSLVFLNRPKGQHGDMFTIVSNADAMFVAFQRAFVPYLQPYAVLEEGESQWNSQAALFCLVQTCALSAVAPLFVGVSNSQHRNYSRGLDRTSIARTIQRNYNDAARGFYPCNNGTNFQVNQDPPGVEKKLAGLSENILKPSLGTCQPLRNRFDEWERHVYDNLVRP